MNSCALLLAVSLGQSCSGGRPPSAPTGVVPSTPPDGRIERLQVARDIIAYNQTQPVNPKTGLIFRWQSPVAIHLGSSVSREFAIDALDYWAAQIGLAYRLTEDPNDLGIRFVESQAGIPEGRASGRVTVGLSDPNNRARTASVYLVPGWASCSDSATRGFCPRCGAEERADLCRNLFRHELGHALGFLEHSDDGLMSQACLCTTLTDRERAMMQALYSLPFGTRVQSDGTWNVVVH